MPLSLSLFSFLFLCLSLSLTMSLSISRKFSLFLSLSVCLIVFLHCHYHCISFCLSFCLSFFLSVSLSLSWHNGIYILSFVSPLCPHLFLYRTLLLLQCDYYALVCVRQAASAESFHVSRSLSSSHLYRLTDPHTLASQHYTHSFVQKCPLVDTAYTHTTRKNCARFNIMYRTGHVQGKID